MTFFGPAEMAGLQDFFSGFLQTTVEIYAKSSGENDYSDDGESFSAQPTAVTTGWLRNQPDTKLVDEAGAALHPNVGRLFIPVDVVVRRGDKVVIDGDAWRVIDHNRENTFKVTQRVALERLE